MNSEREGTRENKGRTQRREESETAVFNNAMRSAEDEKGERIYW